MLVAREDDPCLDHRLRRYVLRLSRSKMARRAIDRDAALRVAGEAITHIEVHRANRGGLLGHIAVAAGTCDVSANVRRMIEFNVSRGVVVIDPHPGDILASGLVSRELLDLRPVDSD